jgi:2,4-dienoyl-CoA reductase-like NADH-dependent reductase (Old Yellow Enzyme family)/thioredoxin reductase
LVLNDLFCPIRIGDLEIKNRIAMAPMGIHPSYPDQLVPDALIHYLETRSKGGVGLIISDGFQGTKHQNVLMLGAYEDRFIPSMRKYAQAIHKHGSVAFLQIMGLGGRDTGETYAPSAIDSPRYERRPKAYSKDQIEEIIDDFDAAAHRGQEAGFDGVELHGAHSYMIGQFISPHFNKRNDEYGGDFERRMRVPTEIVRRTKKTCGNKFPVGFKFSAWESLPNGVNHEEAVKIAQRMSQEGVAYLHVQTADFYPPVAVRSRYPAMSPMYSPRNTLVELSENLKRNIGNTPIVCADGIIDPGDADRIIRENKADMVAIGRALLADPDWPNKARQGRRIRPCIRCNICHHKVVAVEEPIACTVNPYLAREKQEPIMRASHPKNVMVVGSGPSGMTCALVASRRSHNVTLYEKEDEVGGLLVPGTTPPFKKDVRDLLEYYRGEIRDSNVSLELNQTVTPELIRKKQPAALVVAIGARPIKLNIPGRDNENVITAIDALKNKDLVKGKKVVVIGGGEVGCETALYLSQDGKDVSVVEILDDILLVNTVKNNTVVLRELLDKWNVKVHVKSSVEAITDSAVSLVSKDGEHTELPADAVIMSVGLRPDNTRVKSLLDACSESYAIGDCSNPARILEAVNEGDRVARLL